jgi:multicomponent Na+:H+ antiporter subunit A
MMLWLVLAPLLVAPAAPWLARRLGGRAGWLLALLPVALFARFAGWLPLAPGDEVVDAAPWVPGLGVELAFRLDGLAAIFVLLVTGIGALVLIYAGGYLSGDPRLGRFFATLLAFQSAMLGVVLADDLITLFVFWELTSVTSYLLIGFDHQRDGSRTAALKALLVTGVGGLALLAGLLLMAIAAGDLGATTLKLSELAAVDLRTHALYPAILVLVLLGAATKSAQVPFHFWLPEAMAAPTPVSAYLHSATMVKAGIYLLARLHPQLGGTLTWEVAVGGLGAVTMLVAAAMALGQHDLKRILAYSTVAVLGILTMLIGVGTELAVKTAIVFLVAHALYKAGLFMVAGNVDHETGTRDVTVLSGLRRALPWTAAAGVLAALSKAGAPPMFGFIGKELLYKTKLDLETVGGWLVVAAVATNVALVATALMVSVRPFWGPRRDTPKAPHEAPPSMLVGPILLGLLGLKVGLVPGLFERALGSAAATAVAGVPLAMELKLWHGLNTDVLVVMGLSLVTLAVGALVYVGARRWLGPLGRAVAAGGRYGPARAFERVVDGLPDMALSLTGLVPITRLRSAVLTTLVVMLALVAPPLMRAVGGAHPGQVPLPHELVLVAVGLLAALLAAAVRSRLTAVAALGVTGLVVALLFVLYGAPDLAMSQIAVETLSVILLVLVFLALPPVVRRSGSWTRVRDAVVAAAVGIVMGLAVLAAAVSRLEPEVAEYYLRASVPEAFGRNVVNVILVDFRALDTLGEITVVAVAGVGVAALLAAGRRLRHRERRP